jgi:light-harvesting protein B-800-850 alpha chain
MNNAKMWLVVKPTVGVPLFLAGVAIGSFAVHVAVLTNTSWVADFLKGNPINGAATASLALPEADAAQASYTSDGLAGQTILVTLPDGTTARAIVQSPDTLASLN